jgi:hypothetical protein
MVSLAKLLRIRQGIEKKYKNIGLEKFRLSIVKVFPIHFPLHNLIQNNFLEQTVWLPKNTNNSYGQYFLQSFKSGSIRKWLKFDTRG